MGTQSMRHKFSRTEYKIDRDAESEYNTPKRKVWNTSGWGVGFSRKIGAFT